MYAIIYLIISILHSTSFIFWNRVFDWIRELPDWLDCLASMHHCSTPDFLLKFWSPELGFSSLYKHFTNWAFSPALCFLLFYFIPGYAQDLQLGTYTGKTLWVLSLPELCSKILNENKNQKATVHSTHTWEIQFYLPVSGSFFFF